MIHGGASARVLTGAAGVVLTLAFGTTAVGAIDRVDIVDGGASGLDLTVTTPITTIDLPPIPVVTMPPGGGTATDSVANVGPPGVAQVDVLDVATHGTGAGTPAGAATSTATALGVDIGGGAVSADVIDSSCRADGNGASGSSTVVGGSAGGSRLPDGAVPPNTGGAIPGVGSLTLNQQDVQTSPTANRVDVAALDLTLDTPVTQGSVGLGRTNCLAAGPTLASGTTPGGGSIPATPDRSPNDDPGGLTGLLARTGPFAVGPLALAGLALIGTGFRLRRFGVAGP